MNAPSLLTQWRTRINTPVSGATTPRRMWILCAVAIILGVIAGFAAIGLFMLIGLLTHLTLLHDIGTSLPTLRGYTPSLWIIPTALGGAAVVSLFAMWSPVIRGHGIPESLEAILTKDSKIKPRALAAKPLSAAVTIGTGGPFGAEGPVIVTGGSMGSLIGQALSVSPAERKILLATGAAAGMAATFNTPIAAVILAIELVLFERSIRTIVPLAIACSIAAGIHVMAFGSDPLFAVQAVLHVGLAHLPWFILVGLASGLMAVVINKGLFTMEALFRRLPVRMFWWPIIGAAVWITIGMFEPRTLSMGYSAIIDTLNGDFVLGAIAVLFIAKLVSWWVALGSQTSGGTLAPMFLIGALMGAMLGHGVNAVFPAAGVSVSAFALAAMCATFGASTKAILASVVFALEVTGEYHMAIPLLIATGIADLVPQVLLGDRIMTEKLSHRGFKVDFDAASDPLRTRLVHHLMTAPLTLPATATVADVRQLMADENVRAVTVAGPNGHFHGMVTAAGLAREQVDPSTPVHAVCGGGPQPLAPDDYPDVALTRLRAAGLRMLPVVADGLVTGSITDDEIRAGRHQMRAAAETRQPGWIADRRKARQATRAAEAGQQDRQDQQTMALSS